MHNEKTHGYICYESDFHGDDRSFIACCYDDVTFADVLRALKDSRDFEIFDVLLKLGDQIPVAERIHSIIACQRDDVKFWINVFQSDDGVSVSLGGNEFDE